MKSYRVENDIVLKEHESGDVEKFCLLSDIDAVVDRTRDTLDRMEEILLKTPNHTEESALGIMFKDYVVELNELKKIQLLNN